MFHIFLRICPLVHLINDHSLFWNLLHLHVLQRTDLGRDPITFPLGSPRPIFPFASCLSLCSLSAKVLCFTLKIVYESILQWMCCHFNITIHCYSIPSLFNYVVNPPGPKNKAKRVGSNACGRIHC